MASHPSGEGSYFLSQHLEPRIAAQGVQHRLDVDERHKTRTFLICLLKPLERPIKIAQSQINYRDEIRRDVLSLRHALQLRDHLPGFAALTQPRVGVSEVGDEGRGRAGEADRFTQRGGSVAEPLLLNV